MKYIRNARAAILFSVLFFRFSAAFAEEGEILSLDLSVEADYAYGSNFPFFSVERGRIGYHIGPLSVLGDIQISSDGRYGTAAAQGYLEGNFVSVNAAGFVYDEGPISVRAGRFSHSDIVDSPYSLFINSNPIPSLMADVSITGDFAFYTTRWMSLTLRSADGYPDRGANYKAYGVKFGDFRFGFQDIAVYTANTNSTLSLRTSNFDWEYFLSPLPGFFTQYIFSEADQPRKYKQNDNAIMGLFTDYKRPDWYAYGQILIDDICLNRFFKPSGTMIPDKIAWSLGGKYRTDAGWFGLYTGGATKYTFEAYGADSLDTYYGYTYVPEAWFDLKGTKTLIPAEDNMVGFRLGENSLGVQATYSGSIASIALKAQAEYRVAGKQSPGNPWHELARAPTATEFLNDSKLCQAIIGTVGASAKAGPFGLGLSLSGGVVLNALELIADVSGGKMLLAPSDRTDTVIRVSLVGSYAFALSSDSKAERE